MVSPQPLDDEAAAEHTATGEKVLRRILRLEVSPLPLEAAPAEPATVDAAAASAAAGATGVGETARGLGSGGGD